MSKPESWEDYVSLEDLNFKKPESWDAKDFIFGERYYCPICATPESGTCDVLVLVGIRTKHYDD